MEKLEKSSDEQSQLLYYTELGSGPALLLVHGLMVTGEMFEPIAQILAKSHRVIIPDLRGCGKSRELPPPYTVEQQAADLAELLRHLEIESADVLGYSQGGPVVEQLAVDYPKLVRSLILSNTYAYNTVTISEKIEGNLMPLLIRIFGMRRFANVVGSMGMKQVPKEQVASYRRIMNLIAEQDTDIMITEWKEMIAFDGRSQLKEIRCPTLIIAGTKDTAVPMHHAKMLHEGITGSMLVVIEGADHALIWADPDKLLDTVTKFLQPG
jgi:pimeloyl-ACP methyl ester carboxylesterase